MKKINLLVLFSFLLLGVFSANSAKERNLLTKNLTVESLNKMIISDQSWIPFPSYKEREKWNSIPKEIREECIKAAEASLDYDWPTIKATQFLEFERSGSRRVFERTYKERIDNLESLVLAELLEGKGRFIDQIINGAWSFCEQTYWGLSAHVRLQPTGKGLPNVEDLTIDLGTGSVGSLLVWTNYFLKEEFDKVNPFISKRISYEVRKKILEPYYNRTDMWWMGYTTENMNNWNPWVNYNVLNCILLEEKDRDAKIKNVFKVMISLDKFINYYKDDGGCEEGPSYWQHAGGKLLESLELLSDVSKGQINLFDNELIKNMGQYIYKAYIGDGYFINFADASNRVDIEPNLLYRFGRSINDSQLKSFASFLASKKDDDEEHGGNSGPLEFTLRSLFGTKDLMNEKPVEPLISDFWLTGTEIMGARDKEGSKDGFYFAAIGGHNQESHNHNDVGNFILYYNCKPFFVDAGVGTYTRKTFSDQRYEIWNMQSQYHNLPTINGVMQKEGRQFAARNLSHESAGNAIRFSLDIAGAYPKEAMVNKWQRTYAFTRNESLEISDEFDLAENNGKCHLNFLTECQVEEKSDGVISLKGEDSKLFLVFDEKQLAVSLEKVAIDDGRLEYAWSNGLTRIKLQLKNESLTGKINLKIVKSISDN